MSITTEQIISDVMEREGNDKTTNDPSDRGGRTQWGISERNNPEAWADGDVSKAEAESIYFKKYVEGPGFDRIKDSTLRAQLVDFGVHSGPGVAIKRLQEIIGVAVDGVFGSETLSRLNTFDPTEVSRKLAVARTMMLARIVQKDPSQLKFLVGWLSRSLSFVK